MIAKHTPGPWVSTISDNDGGTCFDVYHNADDAQIDVAYLPIGKTYVSEVLAVQEANAKLIAAAPDLLKALQYLVTEIGQTIGYSRLDSRAIAAVAAIAKATGVTA